MTIATDVKQAIDRSTDYLETIAYAQINGFDGSIAQNKGIKSVVRNELGEYHITFNKVLNFSNVTLEAWPSNGGFSPAKSMTVCNISSSGFPTSDGADVQITSFVLGAGDIVRADMFFYVRVSRPRHS